MSAMWAIFSAVTAIMLAAVGELVSEEIRARLDRIPFAILRAATARIPLAMRTELYDEAWLPELHHILRGDEAMPITRLIHGIRYALRIWLAATRIAGELKPADARKALFQQFIGRLTNLTDRAIIYAGPSPFIGLFAGAAIKYRSWHDVLASGAFVVIMCVGRFAIGYVCPSPDRCPMRHRKGRIATVARGLIIPISVIATILNLSLPLIGPKDLNELLGNINSASIWAIAIAVLIGFVRSRSGSYCNSQAAGIRPH